MNYILHSHLFKFDASINIILRQSHYITVETRLRIKILQVNNQSKINQQGVSEDHVLTTFLLIRRTKILKNAI